MKIILTQEEYNCALTYIENRRHGILMDYMPTGENDLIVTLLDKAITLQEELEAYDEAGDDLLLWFINKYHIQEGKVELI